MKPFVVDDDAPVAKIDWPVGFRTNELDLETKRLEFMMQMAKMEQEWKEQADQIAVERWKEDVKRFIKKTVGESKTPVTEDTPALMGYFK